MARNLLNRLPVVSEHELNVRRAMVDSIPREVLLLHIVEELRLRTQYLWHGHPAEKKREVA